MNNRDRDHLEHYFTDFTGINLPEEGFRSSVSVLPAGKGGYHPM